MIYFDSSALAKRYVKETGSETVNALLLSQKTIVTSKLSYPEILSAFMKKHRAGELTEKPLRSVVDQFESDWNCFFIIEFHDDLLPILKALISKYPLKGADTVHLSSALWLKQTTLEDVKFVCSDLNLLKAAESEKLPVINPVRSTNG